MADQWWTVNKFYAVTGAGVLWAENVVDLRLAVVLYLVLSYGYWKLARRS